MEQGGRVKLCQLSRRTQVLLAVGSASAAQLLNTGIVSQGAENIVQWLARGAVHLHIAAGDHWQYGRRCQLAQRLVTRHFVIAQQVVDPQPYAALAQSSQLQTPGAVAIVVLTWQPDEQATLEVKDQVTQRGTVLSLGAAPACHAYQSGQFAVGCSSRRQCYQPDAFLEIEFTADNQL